MPPVPRPVEPLRPPDLPVLSLRHLAVGPVGDLSLDLAAGEAVLLLGPPGAGKSAVLDAVAGFRRPERGEIRLDGRGLAHTPTHRRGIGVVGSPDSLLSHLSLADNVALPLRLRGIRAPERVARMLALLDLAPHAADRPAGLPALLRWRAVLARALVFAPRLLLIDAPGAGLDPAERAALAMDIRRLRAASGATLLGAARDAEDALGLADRVVVLDAGRVLQIGTPAALHDGPAAARVAALTGAVNALPGQVTAIENDLARILLACGVSVEARAMGLAAGQSCTVLVRPERIAVAAIAPSDMGEGAMPATLIEAIVAGGETRLRLLLGAEGAPPAELRVRRQAGPLLAAPGSAISVAWQGHRAWAFPAEAPA